MWWYPIHIFLAILDSTPCCGQPLQDRVSALFLTLDYFSIAERRSPNGDYWEIFGNQKRIELHLIHRFNVFVLKNYSLINDELLIFCGFNPSQWANCLHSKYTQEIQLWLFLFLWRSVLNTNNINSIIFIIVCYKKPAVLDAFVAI